MCPQDELQTLVEAGDSLGVLHCQYNVETPSVALPTLDSTYLYGSLLLLAGAQWLMLMRRRLNRPKIPWRLGKHTVDLRGGQQTVHSVLGGSSGNGKSTALLPLLTLDKPVAAIGFDDSKPLQDWWQAHEHDPQYIHWRMDGTVGWDILSGPALAVAEGLTAGFERSANDTGYFRGLVRNRLVDLINADDSLSRPRNLYGYIDQLRSGTGFDSDTTRASRRWANSFETLLKTLGPALGTDFNLTDAMREGKKVLLLPNRFMLAESADLIGGIGLVQVRRAAAEAGNFLVFVEEAGQARMYERELDGLFQAGRTRGCPTVLITQNLSKLREQITNNVKVYVVFGQETRREAEAAAEHTWAEPADFLGLPVGTCIIRAPRLGPVRAKLPLTKPKVRRNLPVLAHPEMVPRGSSYQRVNQLNGWYRPKALPAPVETVPAWVGNYEVRQQCYAQMRRSEEPGLLWTPERGFWQDGPCLLWQKAMRSGGRPAKKIDGRTATVYIEVYKWAGGTIPESWEIDHLCGVPACCEPNHLEAVTTAVNIARRDGRKRALAALSG